jgi:hypothetical protein
MSDWSKLEDALSLQKKFSDLFFNSDSMSPEKREEQLKTLTLALHSEISGIVEAVNYKEHRLQEKPADVQKILYKTVDAYRYLLAILNLWDIDASEFSAALRQKDDFLHYRHAISGRSWDGQPVVLFDMDDVLANFRKSFCAWATKECGHFIDPESDEYYNVREFKKYNVNSEHYFKRFIDGHGFLDLERDEDYFGLLNHLRDAGYWIQIVTSRPSSNLTCFYDTHSWLARNGIQADGVAFAPEKFVWLTDQKFYSRGKYFAVDDSAKHSAEYAKHGVKVLVPEKPYNQEVRGVNNISYVPRGSSPIDFIPVL